MTGIDGNDVDNVTSDVIFRYWSQMEIDEPSEDNQSQILFQRKKSI